MQRSWWQLLADSLRLLSGCLLFYYSFLVFPPIMCKRGANLTVLPVGWSQRDTCSTHMSTSGNCGGTVRTWGVQPPSASLVPWRCRVSGDRPAYPLAVGSGGGLLGRTDLPCRADACVLWPGQWEGNSPAFASRSDLIFSVMAKWLITAGDGVLLWIIARPMTETGQRIFEIEIY